MSQPREHSVLDAHVATGEMPHFTFPEVADLLRQMDACGVQQAVLGPVGRWVAVDNAEGNRLLAEWTRQHPDRLSHYAVANPWSGSRAADELRRALDAGARGWKVVPAVQGVGLLSPLLEPLLDIAESYRCPVYVMTGVPVAGEPLQLAELALRRPGLRFLMGRSGRTDFSLDVVPAMSLCANIIAETAYNGAGVVTDLVERFGAGRVVFSSDAPFNDLSLELDRVRRARLTSSDLDAVLAGTGSGLFGWPVDTGRAEQR